MLSCSDPRSAADTAVRHALAMSAMLFALPTVLQYGSFDTDISHTLGTVAMYGAGCSGLVWARVAFTREITMEWAKKTFLFSLLVVPIIMAAGAVWWLVFILEHMQVSGYDLSMSRCPQETQFHMHKMGMS